MSWDLHLKPERGSNESFIGALRHALRRIECVTAEGNAFDYQNDDTGVYFGIDINDPNDPPEEDWSPATLTINYARPSPFGREAAQLLSKVARDIPLLVNDPQDDGAWTAFDTDRMVESYRTANRRATEALARHVDATDIGQPVPTALLDYAWEWNVDRAAKDARRKADGRNLWVPKYEFVMIDGRVYSFVFWFDGVATLFPKTELVGLSRNKYPLKAPGLFARKRPSLTFVPRTAIQHILEKTYQPDPVFNDGLSPIKDGGVAGQDMFLARSRDADAVTDPIYLNGDDYKSRKTKPFERLPFDALVDA